MNVIVIIQARMGASRLPGKMLMDVAGKPAIAHVVNRVRQAKRASGIILATTTAPGDDVLAEWAKKNEVACFRGSEQDVLDRYYHAAKEQSADAVVRITGDCPLIDPAMIDAVVHAYEAGDCDYASNIHPPTYPDGLDTEVFSYYSLEKAWKEATLNSEREHVTPYIWKHQELFRMKNYELRIKDEIVDLSAERWTLDTPEDLEFLRRVAGEIPAGDFSFETTLRIVRTHPEWRDLNAMHARNEGYETSLKND
jgi:spore coat polysaccharide biosynthesis protein SpsF (cytidylyltransferase family)